MKKLSRILAVLLTLCMILSMLPAASAASGRNYRHNTGSTPRNDTDWKLPGGAEGAIEIYFTNDIHGAYDNYPYAAGIMRNGDLIVDAGDSIQGSVATSLTNGQCMVDLMNAVGYDLAVPGNHEFDFGFDRFEEIVTGDNTPYVCANLWDKTADKAVLDAYKIFTVEGKQVALVGITTPETLVKSTPTFFQDAEGNWIYDFCNDADGTRLYTVVQQAVDAARAEGADYVVAVGHLGVDEQSEPWTSTSVIANTNGIDALIDGHSHSTFTSTQKNRDGEDVVVAQTGTKLANVGLLTIAEDGTISSQLIPVVRDDAYYDVAVGAAVAEVNTQVYGVKNTLVAWTEVALTTKDPDTGVRAVRNAETNLGDLCADAYRDLLGTDIAFVNGGGVRADIATGDVTYGQIISVHPFGNRACSVEVTGQQIWEALELGAASHPGESGGFLQVSGLTYTINDAVPSPVILDENKAFVGLKEGAPHRVIRVKVGDEPLDVKKTYTLGGHNYMLKSSGDGYTMFRGAKVLKDEVAFDYEVLIRYIRDTLGGVVAKDSIYGNPRGTGRIQIINKVAPPYADVDEDDWYYDAVEYTYLNGLMNGMTENIFKPNGTITRAMLVTTLWRSEGEPSGYENPFTDVRDGVWYTEAAAWASATGIVCGVGDNRFVPHSIATREQVAVILYRYLNAKMMDVSETADLSAYPDAGKVSPYAEEAMKWAVGAGMIEGAKAGEETLLLPRGSATRAQLATLLMRMCEKYPVNQELTLEEYLEKTDYEWFATGKTDYTVQAMMVSADREVYNYLEDVYYTVHPNGEDVLLKGTEGEEWVTRLSKVIKTYTKEDGTELTAEDFVPDTWITLRTKPTTGNFACFVPVTVKLAVNTAWGDVLHVNRSGVPHGAGDYLVCAVDENGQPNLNDVWVVNGIPFPKNYDMTNAK